MDVLRVLFKAIASGDANRVSRLVEASPALAVEPIETGARRNKAVPFFLTAIAHYVYAGDTALHVAAAAHRVELAKAFIARGAKVDARNRRGAEPLHYAADGSPGSPQWNPQGQAATIALLIGAGADPNSQDRSGVTPLHRAVRTRCADAVRTLLAHGADPRYRNNRGSTAAALAVVNSGRSGSGSAAAREQQAEIIELLSKRTTAK